MINIPALPSRALLIGSAIAGAFVGAVAVLLLVAGPLRLELSRTETQLANAGTALAKLERDHAREIAAAADAASVALYEAQQLGNALTTWLLAAETENQSLKEQRDEALVRATTGRRCLDGRALRLLDDARKAQAAADLPGATGSAAAPGGAAAADPAPAGSDGADSWASDTDVARWANHAQLAHDTCRARLGALIEWHEARAR